MQERTVDIAIIGMGSAGLAAYQAASAYTESLLLIDSGPLGTTCARVGCMPSKLLIAAAEAAHRARNMEPFGIRIEGRLHVDGPAVMARVHHERDHFVSAVFKSMDKLPDEARLTGLARFEAPHTLRVGEHTRVHAKRIVIATGSRPKIPEPFKIAAERLVTSDTLFEWHDLPSSVAVFGPGTTGLELAQALARLDVHVRLFGHNGGLGGLSDDTVRDQAARIFNAEFYLDPCADASIAARDGDQVVVTFNERSSGKQQRERFDYVLVATGRQPNVERLALENAGIQLNDQGIPSFDRHTMCCHDCAGQPSHIFIAGDVDHDAPVLHEATDEGRIAGENAARSGQLRASPRRSPFSIVFSDPQIVRVGTDHAALKQRFDNAGGFAIGEYSFEQQGRARIMGTPYGYLRLYGEYGSGMFLGAEFCAPAGEHLGHLLAWAHQQRLSVHDMLDMPFYHPTLEEGLRTALRDLSAKLLLDPALVEKCMECGPGA